nr:acolac_lg: acetolactate synthase, large subunit, biosynthetic [uncultured bacterium]
MEKAFRVALEGIPGPVFVEVPVDLLYAEPTVREFYGAKSAGDIKGVTDFALQTYLRVHLARVFAGAAHYTTSDRIEADVPAPKKADVDRALSLLAGAKRPVFLLGSQVMLRADRVAQTVRSVERLGVPVYLLGHGARAFGQASPAVVSSQPRRGAQGR